MLKRTIGLGIAVSASGQLVNNSSPARTRALEALAGRTIRVCWGAQENPYLFQGDGGAFEGVLVDFLNELRKEVGFIVRVVEISNESFDVVGSNRNTACARDLQRNRTDLCIGNSWVTTQRLGYAKMLPTLWQETLELGVSLRSDNSLESGLSQAFRPFHGWLWLGIFTTIFASAFFAWYVEYQNNDRDFPDKSIIGSGLNSLYHHFFGFFWSDPPTRPITAEGRILAVGFGFFILIILSSYTATLTLLLVAPNKVPEFTGLQDALDNNAKVCMWTSVLSRMERIYPTLPSLVVSMDSNEEGYDNMNTRVCPVILVDPIFHAKAQERSERDCDKVLQGEAVLDINVAWPVADWLHVPMSYFVTDMISSGLLDDLRRTYVPRIRCAESLGEAAAPSLGVAKVSGVFFIIGISFLFATSVYTCKYFLRSKSVRRRCPCPWSKLDDQRRSSKKSRRASERRSIEIDNPRDALVLAFRTESLMSEMPFEKALLVIGEARSRASEELKQALRRIGNQYRYIPTPSSQVPTPPSQVLPFVPGENLESPGWKRTATPLNGVAASRDNSEPSYEE